MSPDSTNRNTSKSDPEWVPDIDVDEFNKQIAAVEAEGYAHSQLALQYLGTMQNALVRLGGFTPSIIQGPTVDEIVEYTSELCKLSDGRTNCGVAVILLTAAALRFAIASVKGTCQKYSPTSELGPDDTIII